MAYKQAYLKTPLNFRLFPGRKMPVDFTYTYHNDFLGMSNKTFNALPRKERREKYLYAADYEFNTDHKTPVQITSKIIETIFL